MSREIALSHPDVMAPVGAGASALSLSAVRAHGRLDAPALTMLLGAMATAVLMVLDVTDAAGMRGVSDRLVVLVSSGAASLALLLMARRGGATILRYWSLAVAVGLTCLGHAAIDTVPLVPIPAAALIGNLLFVAGATLALAVIIPTLIRRLDRQTLISAGLDAGMMLLAGTTILLTLWTARAAIASIPTELLVPFLAAAMLASAFMAAVAALAMRAVPTNRGFWLGIPGVAFIGLSWIIWVDTVANGQVRSMPISLLYSAGILVLSYGWLTWDEEISARLRSERVARLLTDWVPMVAILMCLLVGVIPHGHLAGVDPAPVGTAAVVFLTIIRQRQLIVGERRASGRLAGEVEERAQAMLSLARLERAETIEKTADRICAEALRLEGIAWSGLYAFSPSGAVVPISLGGEPRPEEAVDVPVSDHRAMHLLASASAGTWVERFTDSEHGGSDSSRDEAYAPMRCDDRVAGVVAMGTTNQGDSVGLVERLSTLTEFGVVSAALLGPMLAERWRLADIRFQLEEIIADHAFDAVFQPMVQLRTREVVGFEALTRFRDGEPPDRRFAEAHSAGMSVKLEMACLGEALESASWLPPGTWVSLNISPALARAVVPLVSALERTDRDVVLEITEHVEIGDYRDLVGALALVRSRARLAVDDAGAGYAGLRHILELRPQFVKLDLSLVRNIDTDPARQAMVAGMAHFAQNSGCELIAEGIQTEEELTELVRLGIELGQGYLFGRPAPIS
jgi:EAL domain-containing protein (putative c-di-GMP-specific phosphodiesterase class I)